MDVSNRCTVVVCPSLDALNSFSPNLLSSAIVCVEITPSMRRRRIDTSLLMKIIVNSVYFVCEIDHTGRCCRSLVRAFCICTLEPTDKDCTPLRSLQRPPIDTSSELRM